MRAHPLDTDLTSAAQITAQHRGKLREIRQDLVGRLKELHRRWRPLGLHLKTFQTVEMRQVTQQRDLGFLALLVVLMAWGDASLPRDFLFGMKVVRGIHLVQQVQPSFEAAGRRLVWALVSAYFDDSHISDWSSWAGSAQWAYRTLNAILGTPFSDDKRQQMAATGTFLGLDFDFGSAMAEVPPFSLCGNGSYARSRTWSRTS